MLILCHFVLPSCSLFKYYYVRAIKFLFRNNNNSTLDFISITMARENKFVIKNKISIVTYA